MKFPFWLSGFTIYTTTFFDDFIIYSDMNFTENTNIRQGCLLALDNAKKHLSIAIKIKDISYGIANSHLILASEEALKACCLDRLSINADWVNSIDFPKVFKSHIYKHRESLQNQKLGVFMMEFLQNLTGYFENKKNQNLSKEEMRKTIQEFSKNFCSWVDEIKDIVNQKMESEEKWWNSANDNKNLGFYIDLKDTNDWIGPFNISEEDFKESLKIVSDFTTDIERQINFH